LVTPKKFNRKKNIDRISPDQRINFDMVLWSYVEYGQIGLTIGNIPFFGDGRDPRRQSKDAAASADVGD